MKKNLLPILAAWVYATISCAQGIDGSWHGNLDFGGQKLGIVFHFGTDETGKPSGTMDVPQQGAMDMPVNLSLLTQDSISLHLPAIGMSYSGKLVQDKIRGVFTQNGVSFPMNLEPGNIEPARAATAFRLSNRGGLLHQPPGKCRILGYLNLPDGVFPEETRACGSDDHR